VQETSADKFPLIVAVGASAGGLQAFESFLTPLTRGFGFAVIFIQHLSAQHQNLLPELIRGSRSDLEIIEITEGTTLLPGRIYLCPRSQEVRVERGVLHLHPLPEGRFRLPIDEFFTSLAADAGEKAVAVVLSGDGTDGARGVRAIRSAGGGVFVQDPATAEFAGMPLAVISTGQADVVLPPEDIAWEILKLQESEASAKSPEDLITPAQFETFYRLIREKTGSRFNHYKKSVVARRIRRRMYLHGVPSLREYAQMITDNDAEAAQLAADLMIGVTAFFRDRVAWRALRIEVVSKLAAENDTGPLRIWTPACATGEEAYSMAMMLHHELALLDKRREIQVFATDVNDQALERARDGKYPETITADVPSDYLRNYFMCSEDGLSVSINKEIRDCVVFAKQDLLTDPPFSRLDTVICRNLLIYLEPHAQEKCLSLFHYALKDGGYLFLGNAESVGGKHGYFKTIGHKKCRIYRKIAAPSPARLPLSVPYAAERAAVLPARRPVTADRDNPVTGYVQEALLEEFAPAAVAIDQNYNILYHNGPTNRYLRQPRGIPTQNLLELLPENLRSRIRGGLYRTVHEAKAVSIRARITGPDEEKRQATLRLSTLPENLILITFMEKGVPSESPGDLPLEAAAAEETAVRQLESELFATRQDLQSHIEQLKSLNEELQSSNEELQAANEELETSREELQSLNEELVTVNAQLQSKIEEQDTTNNDLNNFLASTNIPTIFLDHQFRLKRFTPAMSLLIKLIPSDVGRPIFDMSQENLGPELIEDARAVLEKLVPIRKEMKIEGACYVRATLPYRTTDNHIGGVVITYTDVSELKEAEARSRHLASFPQLNPNPVLELDASGKITYVNPAAGRVLESLGMNRENAEVFLPGDIEDILRAWDGEREDTFYHEVGIGDRVFNTAVHLTPQFKVVRVYAYEITKRKQAEEKLRESQERFRDLAESMSQLVWVINADGHTVYLNRRWLEYTDGALGTEEERRQLVHPDDLPGLTAAWREALHGTDFECEYRIRRRDGIYRWFLTRATAIRANAGVLTGWIGTSTDIHDLKQAEEERETTVSFLRLVNESQGMDDLLGKATGFIKERSHCEAVGVRLRREHDFPYYETAGFPEAFIRTENSLCIPDAAGNAVVDATGDPVLDCMCGNVISGHFDPAQPFFTNRGSFWTNSSTELLALTAKADRQIRTRNRCQGEGYESVALIPLVSGAERLGLLQLNDRQKGRFSPKTIAFWERLAGYLAVALVKFRAEEALRDNEQQLKTIIRNINEGLIVADLEGRIFHWNPAAVAMLDFTDLEECRRRAPDFTKIFELSTDEGHLPAKQRPLARVLKGETLRDWEVRLRRRDKDWQRVFSYSGTLAKDETGKPLVAVLTFSDVTARKRTEENIFNLNKDIAAKNVELEAANRDLASFIYSVSHDLRGPLRSMGVFAKIIADKCVDKLEEKEKDYFSRISVAATKMNRLIEDLLYLSRVSRQEIKRTSFDLSEMVGHILTDLRDSSSGRRVTMEIKEGLVVLADPQLTEIALANLLGNAWKFTSKTASARIVMGTLEREGRTVYFVEDNGAGFDPTYAGKMFQPFQRLHSDQEFEGTGIGLAIVEQAIRRQGGKVWAEGRVGKGATVYFTLS